VLVARLRALPFCGGTNPHDMFTSSSVAGEDCVLRFEGSGAIVGHTKQTRYGITARR
jgi:hypothetical protein